MGCRSAKYKESTLPAVLSLWPLYSVQNPCILLPCSIFAIIGPEQFSLFTSVQHTLFVICAFLRFSCGHLLKKTIYPWSLGTSLIPLISYLLLSQNKPASQTKKDAQVINQIEFEFDQFISLETDFLDKYLFVFFSVWNCVHFISHTEYVSVFTIYQVLGQSSTEHIRQKKNLWGNDAIVV